MDLEEKLRRAAQRYARDREKLEGEEAAANARRDEVIRQAADAGLTRRKIAQLVGVSHQRVNQIIHNGGGKP
ncbi:MAG TPA: helix-turn-helix domain-containing protein [Solirubrobacteraceae bacterium]|jgi:transposase-like protein|nr:helix-turn-helix domain-containing protein [Solirubrobacteraceae bacterium]